MPRSPNAWSTPIAAWSWRGGPGADRTCRPSVGPTGDRTFAELNARANQLVRALRRLGLQAGDGVALLCTNRPEFVEVGAACQRAGLRLTTSTGTSPPTRRATSSTTARPKALVADARLRRVAAGAGGRHPGARCALAVGGDIEGFRSYDDELAGESGTDIDDPVLGSLDALHLGHHRPTEGRRTGATPPPPSRHSTCSATATGEDRHLCTGPLYHAAPLAFSLDAAARPRAWASC